MSEQPSQGRDPLGQFCFWLHVAVLIYAVSGWLITWRPALEFYLVFVPAIFVQWQLNRDSCILNNIESWLRSGQWRNSQANAEEGAWLPMLASRLTGFNVTVFQTNLVAYSALALVWLLAFARLRDRL